MESLEMPSQAQLANDLTVVLDAHYPPQDAYNIEGYLVWNPNRHIAETLAKMATDHCNHYRAKLSNQLREMLINISR